MSILFPPLKDCPNKLTDDQIKQFREDGSIAFASALSEEEVRQARAALSRIARDLLSSPESIYSAPKGSAESNHGGASYKRANFPSMIQLEPGYDPATRSAEESELKVRKYMWFCKEDEVFQRMVSPRCRLHSVVESLLGLSPILFQEMSLVKPPFGGVEKPWHQDNAYFSVAPLSGIIGVWIALDDAGVENGCMHVIPGGHASGAFKHHHGKDCEIDPALLDLERVTPVPVPAGGAMFFFGMLPHETPPNTSHMRRRALQFHFRGAETRIIDEASYDALFIDRSGVAASCRAASRFGF